MSVRYKYQVIQALDEKIGRDLRTIVEGYLESDRAEVRSRYDGVCRFIEFAVPEDGAKWLHGGAIWRRINAAYRRLTAGQPLPPGPP